MKKTKNQHKGITTNLEQLLDLWGDAWCEKNKTKRIGAVHYKGDWAGKSKTGRSDKKRDRLRIETGEHIFEKEVFKPSRKPVIVHTKQTVRRNDTEEDIKATIEFGKTFTSSAELEVTTGLQIGIDCEISFGIPAIVETAVTVSVTGSVERRRSTVKGTEMNFGESDEITCPPGKVTCVTGTIEKHYQKVDFKVPICLSGVVVLVCKTKISGHKRQPVSIQEVFSDLFEAAKTDEKLAKRLQHFSPETNHVNFMLHGSIETQSYHSNVKVSLKPINQEEFKADQTEAMGSTISGEVVYESADASGEGASADVMVVSSDKSREQQLRVMKASSCKRTIFINSARAAGKGSKAEVTKFDANDTMGAAQERLLALRLGKSSGDSKEDSDSPRFSLGK